MSININHPTFLLFLESVTNNILSHVQIENYFSFSQEKKISTQYVILTIMKNSMNVSSKLTDADLKTFVVILWNKNEHMENYEMAGALKDISENFDIINEFIKTNRDVSKKIRKHKQPNDKN